MVNIRNIPCFNFPYNLKKLNFGHILETFLPQKLKSKKFVKIIFPKFYCLCHYKLMKKTESFNASIWYKTLEYHFVPSFFPNP